MRHPTHHCVDWLNGLSTRELVIILLELARAREEEPSIEGEVNNACAILRQELHRREWPARAKP